MALSRGLRSCTALLLALAVFFQPCAAHAASFGAQTLNGLFDGGKDLPVILPPSGAADAPAYVAPRPVVPRIFFNGLQLPSYVFSRKQRISKKLISIINATQSSMDLALYAVNLPNVTQRVIAAHKRGVVVRIIVDRKSAFVDDPNAARSQDLDLLIKHGVPIRVLPGPGQYGLMHNKLGIYDGKLLSAGSFNWTTSADDRHFENAVFRDQPELIEAFQQYWDWMWERATALSGPDEPSAAGGEIPRDLKPALSYKGQAWPSFAFSPQGGTEELLIKAIDLCRTRLEIAMFSFYSENIGRAVVRAHQRGVAVRLVMDRGQGRNTPIKNLFAENGVDFRFSSGIGGMGVLHHKFALFDGEMLGNGSFNYSKGAEANNYEHTLFSTAFADINGFEEEFEFLYQQADVPSLKEMRFKTVSFTN